MSSERSVHEEFSKAFLELEDAREVCRQAEYAKERAIRRYREALAALRRSQKEGGIKEIPSDLPSDLVGELHPADGNGVPLIERPI